MIWRLCNGEKVCVFCEKSRFLVKWLCCSFLWSSFPSCPLFFLLFLLICTKSWFLIHEQNCSQRIHFCVVLFFHFQGPWLNGIEPDQQALFQSEQLHQSREALVSSLLRETQFQQYLFISHTLTMCKEVHACWMRKDFVFSWFLIANWEYVRHFYNMCHFCQELSRVCVC